MRTEPPRKRKTYPRKRRYNESPPLSLRVGAIQADLDARSDGTHAGYRATIVRDMTRYYEWIGLLTPRMTWTHDRAIGMYNRWVSLGMGILLPDDVPMSHLTLDRWTIALLVTDALERAHILVDAGLPLDAALIRVGLVATEMQSPDSES